jgi:signal peptidase I
MDPQATPLTDQLANISPAIIVAVILGCTLVRLFLAKIKDPWARTVSETCDTVNFVLALAFLLIRPFVAQAFYIPSESMENTLLTHDRLIVNKFQYRFQDPQRGNVMVFAAPPEATGGPEQDFIKRLIGMPGETIEVRGAHLKIDGEDINPQTQGFESVHSYLKQRLGLSPMADSLKFFSDHIEINTSQRLDMKQLAAKMGQPDAKIEVAPGQTLINGKPLDEPYTREDPGYDMDACQIPAGQYYMLGDNRNFSRDSHFWKGLEKRRIIGHAVFVFWPPARIGTIK